jgi:hypothetical protein
MCELTAARHSVTVEMAVAKMKMHRWIHEGFGIDFSRPLSLEVLISKLYIFTVFVTHQF